MSDVYQTEKASNGVSGLELDAAELELINRHTLRELGAQEVYAFKVTLCDNQVDRDGERFSTATLHKLAELFIGKTGVFDHNPKASNQTARIYHTEILANPERAGSGEPYAALAARAYMLRDDSTLPTVRSIEAGILKEVSVGCAIGKITCSVCGADQKNEGCAHKKGQIYNGEPCYHLLNEPTDAYEWSFVAVPAQPGAGVTKSRNLTAEIDVEVVAAKLRDAIDRVLSDLSTSEEPDQTEPGEKSLEPDSTVQKLLDKVNKLLEETERSTQK